MMSYDYPHPVSRTYQYKKITKPLLERKRRARINRCLDELKDLMVDALETEGENISKLEKADILELTVRHLQRLQASRPSGLSTSAIPGEDSSESRWRSGFGHCAAEACRFLTALPGEAADRLARHLASGLHATRQLEVEVSQNSNSPPLSPPTPRSGLVSPRLASLDKTAQLLVPSSVVSPCGTRLTDGSPPPRQSVASSPRASLHPYSLGKTSVASPCRGNKETTPSITGIANQVGKDTPAPGDRLGASKIPGAEPGPIVVPTVVDEIKVPIADDEEEIDVENIDESDPMWRPW